MVRPGRVVERPVSELRHGDDVVLDGERFEVVTVSAPHRKSGRLTLRFRTPPDGDVKARTYNPATLVKVVDWS